MTIFEDFIYPGVRITFAIFLVIAFLFYLAEFATDQSDDLGFWKTQWQIAITNLSGKYPGHKGEAGYIVLFVFNVLLTILGLASIYFCNLYWMVVPFAIGYIIVVSVDGHLLGTVYTNLGFWEKEE
ncbi:hypothetical protein BLOT_008602 [Blomia tropicalis]|nr:hypothetical protein BLOT_008602 [Blomia tropicalis]